MIPIQMQAEEPATVSAHALVTSAQEHVQAAEALIQAAEEIAEGMQVVLAHVGGEEE